MVYPEWLLGSEAQAQITQLHGSMKAKKVLNMLKDIGDKKEQQAKLREEALKKKMHKKHSLNGNHSASISDLNV